MNTNLTTIVVIGAGQAGSWAVRTLRDEGFKGRVVLIGDEPHPPMNARRCPRRYFRARQRRKACIC
nr:FAD-dependent oxidoreductase [Cupriavidus sp. D39]